MLSVIAARIGAAFVDDPIVIAEVARILPIVVAAFFIAGPLMLPGSYFLTIGDSGRAALLV